MEKRDLGDVALDVVIEIDHPDKISAPERRIEQDHKIGGDVGEQRPAGKQRYPGQGDDGGGQYQQGADIDAPYDNEALGE